MTQPITEDDVTHSLELYNLLQVCQAAAQQLGDLVEKDWRTRKTATMIVRADTIKQNAAKAAQVNAGSRNS